MKIGIFDSGVGGLSVYLELKKIDPDCSVIYFSDSANFPYGEKTQNELEKLAQSATERLISSEAEVVVVACNSATVSVIDKLRSLFPDKIFVGVEPAVKLGEKASKNGKIGLLATKKTVITHRSDLLVGGVQIYRHHAPVLIDMIENDYISILDEHLDTALQPLLQKDIDTVVLGCTHFYFLAERFRSRYPDLVFVEPAASVAIQVNRLVGGKIDKGTDIFFVSGNRDDFETFITNVLGVSNADIRRI